MKKKANIFQEVLANIKQESFFKPPSSTIKEQVLGVVRNVLPSLLKSEVKDIIFRKCFFFIVVTRPIIAFEIKQFYLMHIRKDLSNIEEFIESYGIKVIIQDDFL